MHGTVNVFLANKNGLVVVTDSRLSNGQGQWRDDGQKLFRIDDRTICAIAGWYSDLGPAVRSDEAGGPSYPASATVPDIIQMILSIIPAEEMRSLSLERKMEILSSAFSFSLLTSYAIYNAAGVPQTPQQLAGTSEITIAGYDDNGALLILQTDIVPDFRNGEVYQYKAVKKTAISVSKSSGLIKVFRGIPTVAVSLMDCSDISMHSDVMIAGFKDKLVMGRGESLSLSDMAIIAGELEKRTAQEFPRFVGGPQQVAEMSGSRITRFEEPVKQMAHIPRSIIGYISDFEGDLHGGGSWVVLHGGYGSYLAQRVKISNGRQALDKFIIFDSEFVNMKLTYSGFPASIFDRSNKVVNSTLTLLPGADLNSTFVRRIKADFPTLTIIDQTKPSEP
jgi:hypothetical protein